jgi:5-(carboxyamino)imidazole ribonucleotide synthase
MTNSAHLFVGILGDGQLARMMCQEAHKLNIKTSVMTTSLKNPACLVNSDNFLVDDISPETILAFAMYCKQLNPDAVLTIESEFINPEFLSNAQAKTDIKIFPSVKDLAQIRDRKPQKEFLLEHKIPTSPSYTILSLEELKSHLSQKPVVLKKRLFGYDGYGTVILNNQNDLEKLSSNLNEKSEDSFKAEEWIYEDFIPFKRELAVSFARNPKGDICVFPWVETHQENSKCLWVKGPMSLSKDMKALQTQITKALESISYVGFVTFEVFESKLGDLLINEIAPRVHNSAHYSLEALYLNQFKAHLLAVLDIDLPTAPKVVSPFAMYNLIASKEIHNPQIPATSNSYFLNWYQKNQSRPGRKMGHITSLASTFEEALIGLKENAKDFDL